MTDIRCVFLERTSLFRELLRRYGDWTCHDKGYHNAQVVIADAVERPGCDWEGDATEEFPMDDPRWPTKCEKCGYEFKADNWQHTYKRLYRHPDGTLYTLWDAPIGSMYYADWWPEKGSDGHSLAVVLPPDRHVWMVDSRASNCTLPEDKEHRCWVRHGEPPNVTVDKFGLTCSAGAGSIQTKTWHGFLRKGFLVEC